MSIVSITKALEKRLAAMPGNIATAVGGIQSEYSVDTPYQTAIVIPSRPDNPTLGDGYYRDLGIFRVRLFYPSRKGMGAILTQAELIRDWFQRGTTLSEGSIKVQVEKTPIITPASSINNRLVVAVDILYFVNVYN